MTCDELKDALEKSVKCLLKERNLLCRVGERAVSSRLSHHLECNLCDRLDGLSVDAEYDKNDVVAKFVFDLCSQNCNKNCYIKSLRKRYAFIDSNKISLLQYVESEKRASRPDIIVHERGSNYDNQLVVEVKMKSNKNTQDILKDKAKLCYFTCDRADYKFKLGAFVEVDEHSAKILWFKNGEIDGEPKEVVSE